MDKSADVVSLQDLCLLTVDNYLSPSNVWSIYRLVPYVHCTRIEYIVHSFICDNFMDVSHTHQFLALDEKEMQWLVDNEEIVASEAAVFDGLARWYKHSQHQRESAFKQLFDSLHLSVMGRDVLSDIIKKYKLSKVIPNLRKYTTVLPRLANLDELIYQENISNIAVLGGDDWISTPFSIIDPKSTLFAPACHWMPLASRIIKRDFSILEEMGEKLLYPTAIPFRDNIFIMGLMLNEELKPVNIGLDFNFQTLTHFTPFTEALGRCPLTVTCGMYIYLLGGTSGHAQIDVLLDTVYRYNTVKDEWKQMARMIHCHSRADCAFSYNNRYLYVFGTHSEKYDMYRNTWTLIAPPWQGGEGDVLRVSGDASNNKIYLYVLTRTAAGCNPRLFVYDPTTDTWQSIVKQRYYCLTRSIFGQTFLLFHRKPVRCIPRKTPELRISILDQTSYKETKLASVNKGLDFIMEYSHMIAISRGARMRIAQNKTMI